MAETYPRPEGRSAVCPFLMVDSVEKELEFLKKVFGAEVIESVKLPDGFISHAEVKIVDSSIMMGRATPKFPRTSSMVYVYVSDADSVYKKALENKAESIMPPEDRFYGIREGGVKDEQGNTWWIAKFLRKVPQEEIQKAMQSFSSQQ